MSHEAITFDLFSVGYCSKCNKPNHLVNNLCWDCQNRLYVIDLLSDGWAVCLNDGKDPGTVVKGGFPSWRDANNLRTALTTDAEDFATRY